ncbi:BTB/POZ domain-containing protein 3-like [Mya arenaria]|uniref:BTB/POZ domain-containing protein 3-like n=1 Tax=Mya arenaria TaxID=6604 RepID=UPI0022E6B199|nr:BTB/POZ domain-containing protein 3-like [Mya arenaria]
MRQTDSIMQVDSWQHVGSFALSNKEMLERGVLTDVTIVAGSSGERLKCHKFILASRSPVLYTMFCGALPETDGHILVPDIEASVLKQFLSYLYCGQCSINNETVMALMYAANKYDVLLLLKECSKYLEENINSENVCTILNQSILFEENVLVNRCLLFISKHSSAVFQSESFVTLSKPALKAILELDALNCDELKVYHATKKWAVYACKEVKDSSIRETMADLLHLIRFPTMDIEDFNKYVGSEEVLNKLEKEDIKSAIQLGKSSSYFKSKTRCPDCASPFKIETTHKIERGWGCGSQIQEGINFRISRQVKLRSVALYLPCVGGSVCGILNIEENGSSMHSQKVVLRFDKDERFKYLKLNSRVTLHVGPMYSLRYRTEGTCTWVSQLDQETQTINNIDIEFEPDQKSTMTYGQVHGFEIE